jgi:hypothetical protein
MVAVDGEVGVACEVAEEVVHGTPGEGDDDAALGADEVMTVPRLSDDVGGMATGL